MRSWRPATASASAAASCKVVWVRPAAADAASPFTGGVGAAARADRVPWDVAVRQLGRRLAFANPAFALEDCVLGADGWQAALANADLVVGGDLGEEPAAELGPDLALCTPLRCRNGGIEPQKKITR